MSEINDIKELPEVIYHVSLKIFDKYHQKDPRLIAKYITIK